jgi:exopolysaccharide/PEP-CTERM locus tyrosine autokinase
VSLIENTLGKVRRAAAAAAKSESLAPPRALGVPGVGVPVEARPDSPTMPDYEYRRVAVDIFALRAAGHLSDASEDQRFAEHFRRIKRSVVAKAIGAGAAADARLVAVTSPLPGDGKTFTSINLAFSLSRERDLSVLLVDADLHKSQITRDLRLEDQPGLVDALLDESRDAESFVLRTDIPGLDILPAGRSVEDAPELAASARMAQIVTRLVARNPRRLVLLDCAPVLAASEVQGLMQLPGQVLLVVRAGQTPQQAVVDAIAQLDPKRLQGLILNDARHGAATYYGYSGYYGALDDAARAG